MSAIIYDFNAIGGVLRKQCIDDWWQPENRKPEPKADKPVASDDLFDPFGRFNWEGWTP